MVVLTLLVGNQNYNGAGMEMVQHYFEGDVRPEAFMMKIIFPALTIGAGFKGGEIVPLFLQELLLAACLEILSFFLRRFVRQLA